MGPAVPFQRPALPPWGAIGAYATMAYDKRWFANRGPCARLLRERLEARVGVGCLPVSSATTGLTAAADAIVHRNDSAGGEALIPSFTFPATLHAVVAAGLRPRLLDVDRGHWHLDPRSLERALQDADPGTVSLVVAVTAFGTPPPVAVRRRWVDACRAAGVPLLVDAAASFGARCADGVPVGAIGDVDVVSFHATKPFAIGEGGAVFTADDALLARIETAINFGLDASGRCVQFRGLNGKMSELHAATGLAVLDTFDDVLARRRGSAARLRAVADPSLAFQAEAERSTWQFVPVAFPDGDARQAASDRAGSQVGTRRYYRPLHEMEPFAALPVGRDGLRGTDELASRVLCYPMANDLSDDELSAVLEQLAGSTESVGSGTSG